MVEVSTPSTVSRPETSNRIAFRSAFSRITMPAVLAFR